MIYGLENLTEGEINCLLEAPALITIRIGGADHEIDQKEKEWGQKISKFRSAKGDKNLQDFYRHVEETFSDCLKQKLEEYSHYALNHGYMAQKAGEELKNVNPVLKKLPQSTAISLYESFKSFAVHIAEASGGFLKMGSISPSEQDLLNLEMIEDPSEDHPENPS